MLAVEQGQLLSNSDSTGISPRNEPSNWHTLVDVYHQPGTPCGLCILSEILNPHGKFQGLLSRLGGQGEVGCTVQIRCKL